MTAPVSQHHPLLAGDDSVAITASLEVDTGLRDTLTFVAGLVASAVAANEKSIVSYIKTKNPKINTQKTAHWTIYVFKGGTNHGDAGDSAVNCSWLAVAK